MKNQILRSQIVNLIRTFFLDQGFLEVETPLLVSSPDPSCFNEVFETSLDDKQKAYLAPSPEFFMKKILVKNPVNIFQICKAFRNPQETDPLHNPEFTILEWYRTKATYTDLMRDCENLVDNLFKQIFPKKQNKLKKVLKYQDHPIDLSTPWTRVTIKELFKKYAKIDLNEFLDLKKAKKIAQQKGYRVELETRWEQFYHQIFLNEIEPKLPKSKPFFLYDYPYQLAEGAKLKEGNQLYAERFELYLGGLEIANGYSELTDWKQQEKRLKQHLKQRKSLKMKVFDYDRDFISCLKKGLPKTAGIALGIDRLVMLFADARTIQEVISFPASEIFKNK